MSTSAADPAATTPPRDLHLAGLVIVLLLAFSPALYHRFWTLRVAALLIAVGGGSIMLAVLARNGDVAARAAIGFLVIAAASTLLSDNRTYAFFGSPNWGTGLLFLFSCTGVWALGATRRGRTARAIEIGLLACGAINVAAAVSQAADVYVFDALRFDDRPFGLTGNAVHLGLVCAMCLTLALARPGRTPLVLAPLFSLGLQLSGGRSALALGVVAVGVGTRGWQWRRRLPLVLVCAAAVAVGAALSPTTSATTRAASTVAETGSMTPRMEAWKAAAHAVTDRPLFGWGPGRFAAASTP